MNTVLFLSNVISQTSPGLFSYTNFFLICSRSGIVFAAVITNFVDFIVSLPGERRNHG